MATSELTHGRDDVQADEGTLDELFQQDLESIDPAMVRLMKLEDERQVRKIILIASESFAPAAVREATDSSFANLYAEGLPSTRMSRLERRRLLEIERQLAYFRRYGDRRYYKGCEYANLVEALAQARAAELFATDRFPDAPVQVSADDIYCNVQPLSGAAANNAVYTAFASPGDVIMGMSLTTGGHLTHGSHVNRSGKQFRVVSYEIDAETGRLDYDAIHEMAREHRPRILIAGYSAYPFHIDWMRFRQMADEVGAILLADISHPAGLVVSNCFPSPIGIADVVMTTTHKTLCGPRGAILLTTDRERARAIDLAVFPGEQGGPHVQAIAAKAVAFKIARTDAFRQMQERIVKNASYLARCLAQKGIGIAYGGTETHLFLIDLKSLRREGERIFPEGEVVSRILDLCGITCNKNTIAGDRSALRPTALRIGVTWITQLGFGDREIEKLADAIHRVLTSIRPFAPGGGVRAGRARIPFAVMEEVRCEVADLIASVQHELPELIDFYAYSSGYGSAAALTSPLSSEHAILGGRAEPEGGRSTPADYGDPEAEVAAASDRAVLVDVFDGGLVRVSGERAREFLQEATTGNVAALEPGRGLRALVLQGDGTVLAEVGILRRPDSDDGADFVLSANPRDTQPLVRWLQSLSDGYVEFEPGDLGAKIDGPVMVEDLRMTRSGGERWTRLLLAGPKAAEILARMWNGASSLAEGESVEVEWQRKRVVVFRQPDRGTLPCYDLRVHASEAGALWNSLLEEGSASGLVAAGWEAWRRVRESYGGAVRGSNVAEDHAKDPSRVNIHKPYFIGQTALHAALKPEPIGEEYVYTPAEMPLRETPIYARHLERTMESLMAPFGGWRMPLWYGKVSEEHEAVRETVALFDVTHMGVLGVRGRDACAFLDQVTTNYVSRLRVGKSQYSYILDPQGVILDDIIVYRVGEDDYQVVVNAANAEKIMAWLEAVVSRKYIIDVHLPERAVGSIPEIRDLRDPSSGDDRRIDIALQGPRSRDLIMELCADQAQANEVHGLGGFSHCEVELQGIPTLVSRTGYTGETFGYELFVHPDRAVELWDLLLERGAAHGIQPAGLAARDSTRTEAGFPLYGHELAGDHVIDPIEAGYGSFVKFHKPFFIGRRALLEYKDRGKRKIVRFRAKKGRKFEHGDPVFDSAGNEIGVVTSGTVVGNALLGLALVSGKGLKAGVEIGVGSARRGGDPRPATLLRRFPRREADHGPLDPPLA